MTTELKKRDRITMENGTKALLIKIVSIMATALIFLFGTIWGVTFKSANDKAEKALEGNAKMETHIAVQAQRDKTIDDRLIKIDEQLEKILEEVRK